MQCCRATPRSKPHAFNSRSSVVANLTLALLEALPAKPPTLIASGFLAGQRVPGLVERDRRELDGWAAIVA